MSSFTPHHGTADVRELMMKIHSPGSTAKVESENRLENERFEKQHMFTAGDQRGQHMSVMNDTGVYQERHVWPGCQVSEFNLPEKFLFSGEN